MDISSSYRRPALKLIARVRRLGKRSDRAGSRVVALTAIAVVIVAAWVATAFSRVSLARAQADAAAAAQPCRPPVPATTVSQSSSRTSVLAKRDAIVYIVAGDATSFHAPAHAPGANRQ